MSKKPFTGIQSDKLIIALQLEEMVGAINLALRVRRGKFTLDYSNGHFPRLILERPDVEPEQIMLLDPRKHASFSVPPRNKELFILFSDFTERLYKLGARLMLTGEKPKQGQRRAKLQLHVSGARRIALTLMEVSKGEKLSNTSFQLPDGSVP